MHSVFAKHWYPLAEVRVASAGAALAAALAALLAMYAF